jgi:hypothetical protein
MTAIPRPPSRGEEEFALHCKVYGLTPEREYVFHATRKWRIDFCWPDRKLAVEIESSVHRIKGRFSRDMEKYNAIQLAGLMLLRFTAKDVKAGTAIDTVLEMLRRDAREPLGSSGRVG